MANLIYYGDERKEFQEEFKKELPNLKAVRIIVGKLQKHFKLGDVDLDFTSGRNHSHASRWHITINVEQTNFGVICHELAHVFQARKLEHEAGDKWHTKKHKRIMKRMLAYCRKKNWFEVELGRRLAEKPFKPELTKEEQRAKRIKQLEIRKQSYTRKIKLSENRVRKLNRQISALKRFV